MINLYLQNFVSPGKSLHGTTAGPAYPLRGGIATPLGNLVKRLRGKLVEIDRKRRSEYENRRAIAHLQSLTDAQLADVGIRRLDIERCVRHGREAI